MSQLVIEGFGSADGSAGLSRRGLQLVRGGLEHRVAGSRLGRTEPQSALISAVYKRARTLGNTRLTDISFKRPEPGAGEPDPTPAA